VAFMGPLVGFWLKPGRSVGRVDGIIETCKIVSIILKIHLRPCGTRINKQQTNKQTYLMDFLVGQTKLILVGAIYADFH
jgi:hypothetical protein